MLIPAEFKSKLISCFLQMLTTDGYAVPVCGNKNTFVTPIIKHIAIVGHYCSLLSRIDICFCMSICYWDSEESNIILIENKSKYLHGNWLSTDQE